MGGVTLVLMLMLDLMGFPSLTAWERGSLQAVQNWPESERRTFIVVGLLIWSLYEDRDADRSTRVLCMLRWDLWTGGKFTAAMDVHLLCSYGTTGIMVAICCL